MHRRRVVMRRTWTVVADRGGRLTGHSPASTHVHHGQRSVHMLKLILAHFLLHCFTYHKCKFPPKQRAADCDSTQTTPQSTAATSAPILAAASSQPNIASHRSDLRRVGLGRVNAANAVYGQVSTTVGWGFC